MSTLGDPLPEAASAQLRVHVQAQQVHRERAGALKKIGQRRPQAVRRRPCQLRKGQAFQQVFQQVRRWFVVA